MLSGYTYNHMKHLPNFVDHGTLPLTPSNVWKIDLRNLQESYTFCSCPSQERVHHLSHHLILGELIVEINFLVRRYAERIWGEIFILVRRSLGKLPANFSANFDGEF